MTPLRLILRFLFAAILFPVLFPTLCFYALVEWAVTNDAYIWREYAMPWLRILRHPATP